VLGSINPLGERGRQSRWAVAVAAYVLGSLAAGVGVGAALGAIGSLTVSHLAVAIRVAALGALVAIEAAWDGGLLRVPGLGGPSRQVNEDWLVRYRGGCTGSPSGSSWDWAWPPS
jgi:hypothetical protein